MQPLPRFAVDGAHRAALVAGRAMEVECISGETIARCVEAAADFAARSGLPLAFVVAAAPDEAESDTMAAAGFVLAHGAEDEEVTVDKAALTRTPGEVPEAFWQALADAGVTFRPGATDDPDFPGEGVFLVPAGWSSGVLSLGAEKLVKASAESTIVAKPVAPAVLSRIGASAEPLSLRASYC